MIRLTVGTSAFIAFRIRQTIQAFPSVQLLGRIEIRPAVLHQKAASGPEEVSQPNAPPPGAP